MVIATVLLCSTIARAGVEHINRLIRAGKYTKALEEIRDTFGADSPGFRTLSAWLDRRPGATRPALQQHQVVTPGQRGESDQVLRLVEGTWPCKTFFIENDGRPGDAGSVRIERGSSGVAQAEMFVLSEGIGAPNFVPHAPRMSVRIEGRSAIRLVTAAEIREKVPQFDAPSLTLKDAPSLLGDKYGLLEGLNISFTKDGYPPLTSSGVVLVSYHSGTGRLVFNPVVSSAGSNDPVILAMNTSLFFVACFTKGQ